MLTIKTTPNLYGISLQGDYQDLNALYDCISRYLNFYQENDFCLPEHCYEYLLSLNYDIRHAYMGTRETAVMENNASAVGLMAENIYELPDDVKTEIRQFHKAHKHGNLYFSVNILYPLVFHYLITFESILEDYVLPGARTKTPDYLSGYSPIQAEHDRAQIALFNSLVWENLTDLFGKDTANLLYEYYDDMEYFIPPSPLYTDALLHCQLLQFDEMQPEERRSFLLASVFEILGTEDLPVHDENLGADDLPDYYEAHKNIYADALKSLKAHHGIFPTRGEFFTALEDYIPDGQPLYQDVFDRFLDQQYGKIAGKDAEPDW